MKDEFERFRIWTIEALTAEQWLYERLVLKGGFAIGFAGVEPVRYSHDLDFSMDIREEDDRSRDALEARIAPLLSQRFREERYELIELRISDRPPIRADSTLAAFWAGFSVEFKLVTIADFQTWMGKPVALRKRAVVVRRGGGRKIEVDLSMGEHCEGKALQQIGATTVYVYTAQMIVAEKIRAICQQMDEYAEIVNRPGQRGERGRDFFDIHHIATARKIDMASDAFWETLSAMLRAKRVPQRLLGEISSNRERHRSSFDQKVLATLDADVPVPDFDRCVDFLVDALKPLERRWNEQSPP